MTSTPPSRPPTEHTLLATTDASVWAEEFCRIFQGKTIAGPIAQGDVDHGAMIAWFANALETGRNQGRKELCPHTHVSALADDLSCCMDCGTLFEPKTLEESFKEGFDEGRDESD